MFSSDTIRTHRAWLYIVGLLVTGVVATLPAEVLNVDLQRISGLYEPGGPNAGWLYGNRFPWRELYDYGNIPTLIIMGAAGMILLAGLYFHLSSFMRKACWIVLLTIIIGPGIIVNGILKPYWGRPRPADVTQFGGRHEYRDVWPPGGPGSGKSFTCGHCAMAFGLGSLAALYPRYPTAGMAAVMISLLYGVLMGTARMTQGGHFPTDVLWSGIVVFVVLCILYYYVFNMPEEIENEGSRSTAPDI